MEIQIPYRFKPEDLNPQALSVLSDPHRFQVLNWHRKARKTTLAINQLIRWAFVDEAPYWYVGPSFGLAKKTVWDDPHMFPYFIPDWHNPESRIVQKRETDLRIDILPSGGQIYVFGADRPDLMRGPNPHGVILDEYSVMKPEVWNDIIQPVMRSNPRAWCWFLFTPRGKNHAYSAYNFGLRGDSEWKSWQLDVEHSGVFTREQIENARRDMPEATFQQELMCQFLEGEGQVFRGVSAILDSQPQDPVTGHSYIIGIDLAKYEDYTVLSVWDFREKREVWLERFNQIEWPFQKAKIKALSDRYNGAACIIDATGLGSPIVDDLIRDGVPVRPFQITQSSKKDLIEKASIYIQQKRVHFISDPEGDLEFDNFTYELSQLGSVRYGAAQGFHDDIVIARALAVFGMYPTRETKAEPEPSKISQFYKQKVQEYNENENEENQD